MVLVSSHSRELIHSVKALAGNPGDYQNKSEVLRLLKQMKALAGHGDVMAQYHLAQVFPRNSDGYLEWMQAAAKQGLTNAMLDLSSCLAETGAKANLERAARYLQQIFLSKDSYIMAEANSLLEANPLLRQAFEKGMVVEISKASQAGFFAQNNVVSSDDPERVNDLLRP